MTKQELTRSIEAHAGNSWPSISTLARYLGKSREYVASTVVNGLDCLPDGKAKRFFAGDVAGRLIELRERHGG